MTKKKSEKTADPVDEYAELAGYVETLRNALYLQAYEVIVRRGAPPQEGALALIQPVDGRLLAELYVSGDFWQETPKEQRQTITHELLHLVHREASDVIRLGAWIRHVGQGTYDATWEAVRDQFEKMVDRLAVIVAPSLPLPPDRMPHGDEPNTTPLLPHGPVNIDNAPAPSVE